RRIGDDRAGRVRGVHQRPAAVVVALVGDERADDGQVLHLLGDERHVLADLDAGGAGLDGLEFAAGLFARLEVPDVDGGRAAAHPQDDQALVVLFEGGGGGGQVLQERL